MSTNISIEKECIICFELIDNKEDINFFKDCDHCINYHSECINGWINECNENNIIPTCPMCQKEIQLTIYIHSEVILPNNTNLKLLFTISSIIILCTASIFLYNFII